jgi:hypothetical protein
VFEPSKKDRVASVGKRAIRSWNWTVAVAVAFMIALVLTSALSSHAPDPAASGGLAPHQAQGRAVSMADQ